MKTLWLKKGEDRRIRAGHLWIFSNEIDSAKSPLPDFEPGENATLRDARGAVLGSVFVNPHSLICARLYSRKADLPLDADLLRQRLQSALGLRQRLYNQPWYRLCHGEGDLLPGLVMDRFGDHLTVQVGTWGMEARKEELREVLGELLQPRSILWDNDIAARSLEGLPRENESEGPVPDVLEVPENGCIFRAPLQGGQKTGWFYDQRRNRREAARYAAGADVLDIFCYAGGFGGTAAAAGARSVTFLDASPQALALATENAAQRARTGPHQGHRRPVRRCLRTSGRAGRPGPPLLAHLPGSARLHQAPQGLCPGPGRLPQDQCPGHAALDAGRCLCKLFLFTPPARRVPAFLRAAGRRPPQVAGPHPLCGRTGCGPSRACCHARDGLSQMFHRASAAVSGA